MIVLDDLEGLFQPSWFCDQRHAVNLVSNGMWELFKISSAGLITYLLQLNF